MNRKTRSIFIATAALAAVLVPASTAGAAVRYAGAGITGGTCTQLDPCSLATALSGTASGDTVYMTTGTYMVGSTLTVPAGVTLIGIYGTGRPFIDADAGLTGTVVNFQPGSTGRYFGLRTTVPGTTGMKLDDAAGRDLVVLSSGGADAAVDVRTGTTGLLFADAVVEAHGGMAVQVHDGVDNGTSGLLGVTAIGRDGASAIESHVKKGTLFLENVLAHGTTTDLVVRGNGNPVMMNHSNLRVDADQIVDNGGGNQTATPCFVDWAGADYRPIATSPVVGAGFDDSRSPKDGWGITRSPSAEIGGLEWQATAADDLGCQPLTEATDDGGSDPGSDDPPVDPPGEDTPPATDSGSADPTPSGPSTSTSAGKTGATNLPPATQPVVGQTVTIGESSGDLLVRLPGTNKFVPLTAATTIPVGTVVDATSGTVTLTSAIDKKGKTQTGKFWGGTFKIGKARGGYTELALAGDPLVCKAHAKRSRKSATHGLWGQDDHGRFRTRGRNGVATVRGTRWLTEDRCTGTFFKVAKGAIDVRDKVRRKTITLKRGDSYLVKNR